VKRANRRKSRNSILKRVNSEMSVIVSISKSVTCLLKEIVKWTKYLLLIWFLTSPKQTLELAASTWKSAAKVSRGQVIADAMRKVLRTVTTK